MKRAAKIVALATLLSAAVQSQAQEIKLFPDGAPNETAQYEQKAWTDGNMKAGKTVCRITNIGEPTLTIFKADEPNGKAMTIIVSPGGAYNYLTFDLEGSEICKILNDNGFDAALLKYRTPRREGRAKHEAPLEDIQRAISLIRSNASEYGVAVSKVGVIGFSAGAHLSVMACCSQRSYTPIDQADTASCSPDFCALIYPAYLSAKDFQLAEEVTVSSDTPPTFIVQSEDDHSFINSSLFYYYALKEAKVPATMHLYSTGGHGFGSRQTGHPSQRWTNEYIEWLNSI